MTLYKNRCMAVLMAIFVIGASFSFFHTPSFASENNPSKENIIAEHTHTWDETIEGMEEVKIYRVDCNYHSEHNEEGIGIPESRCGQIFEGASHAEAVKKCMLHRFEAHNGQGGCGSVPPIITYVNTGQYETIHHESEDCTDAYTENEVSPTCTDAGGYEEVIYCTYCEKEVYRNHIEFPATGHDYKEAWVQDVKDPTCTEEGQTVGYRCETCGDVIWPEKIPALGHDWETEGTVTTTPTCTDAGVRIYRCTREGCDIERTESIDPTGHNWEDAEVVAEPTCTSYGCMRQVCKNCNAERYETIPKKDHDYKTTVVAPTCTDAGYTSHVCTVCGDSYRTDKIAATGHMAGEVKREKIKNPTCVEEGSYDEVTYCSTCKVEIRRETKKMEKAAHTPETIPAVNPTCTEGGSTEGSQCSVCGQVLAEPVALMPIDHTYDKGRVIQEGSCTQNKITKYTCTVCGHEEIVNDETAGHDYQLTKNVEPTCTEGGYKEYTCTVCGNTYRTDVVDATGHKLISVPERRPTCTEPGLTEGQRCTVCGQTIKEQEEIPATGHLWNDGKVTKKADCYHAGEKTFTCSECGETYTEAIPKTEHDYDLLTQEYPSCTEDGYILHTCTICEDSYKTDIIPAYGHTPGDTEYENVVQATCVKEGGHDEVVYCQTCGEEVSRNHVTYEKTDHILQQIPAVAATCTESGLTEGYKCSICGELIEEQVPVAATGHTLATSTAKAPTCEEDGHTEKTYCKTCGEVIIESQAVPATGHNWGDWVTVRKATDTEDGLEQRTCKTDARHTETRIIPKTSHTHTLEYIPEKAATCTEEGNAAYWTCTECHRIFLDENAKNEVAENVIISPKKEHEYDNGVLTTEATCIQGSITTYTCKNCGATRSEIGKTGYHEYVVTKVIEPTCTTMGETFYACKYCGDSYSSDYRDPLDHQWVDTPQVDATCTEDGHTGGSYCAVCGEILSPEETIFAMGHYWTEWKVTKDATETEEGIETRICANDPSHVETRTIPVKAHAHTIVKVSANPATCETEGNIAYWTCTKCGKYFNDAAGTHEIDENSWTIQKKDHDFVFWYTKKPTCTEQGYSVYFCTECGTAEDYRDYVDATGHTPVTVKGKQATCTESGLTAGKKCSVCGEVLEKQTEIPATGHTWGEWKTITAPTETKEGKEQRICSNCSEVETRTIPVLSHEHTLVFVKAVSASCEADGNTAYWICTDCGRVFADADGKSEIDIADTVVPAIGHLWDKETTTKEASCTEDGIKTVSCSACGAEKTEVIPAVGHSYKATSVVDPTCTEQGYTVYTCEICGDACKDDYTDAIGHDWGEWVVTKTATENEDGLEIRTCKSDSSHTETRVINKLSHTHKLTHVVAKTATADAEGNIEYWYCDDCGKYYKDNSTNVELTKAETVIAKLTDKPEDPGKDDPTPAVKTDISKVIISGIEDSYVFTGKEIVPAVKLRNGSDQLVEGTDYTVVYKDNVNTGTATVTISGTGNYTGVVTKTFTIVAKKVVPVVKLSKASFIYNKKVQKPAVTVTLDGKKLPTSDYTATYAKGSKAVGIYTVTVTLKGNYTGKATATYQIKPKGTAISKLTGAKKAVTVKWKKQATQVTGYQIQYSTNSQFKSGNKTLTVKGSKKTSAKLKKLKAKKTYYVRIRTYRKVNGKTVYSGWSKVKKVKAK